MDEEDISLSKHRLPVSRLSVLPPRKVKGQDILKQNTSQGRKSTQKRFETIPQSKKIAVPGVASGTRNDSEGRPHRKDFSYGDIQEIKEKYLNLAGYEQTRPSRVDDRAVPRCACCAEMNIDSKAKLAGGYRPRGHEHDPPSQPVPLGNVREDSYKTQTEYEPKVEIYSKFDENVSKLAHRQRLNFAHDSGKEFAHDSGKDFAHDSGKDFAHGPKVLPQQLHNEPRLMYFNNERERPQFWADLDDYISDKAIKSRYSEQMLTDADRHYNSSMDKLRKSIDKFV